MKNKKITAEEQDMGKLGKLCSERKACRQKWLATLCLSGRRICITWYLCLSKWDRLMLMFGQLCPRKIASQLIGPRQSPPG